MIKRNSTKPVRVVPPMMEEQEISMRTLEEWLDREETVSHLLFRKGREEGIDKSYKSFKNCTFQHQTFSECKFRSSPTDRCAFRELRFIKHILFRKRSLPGRVCLLQTIRNQFVRDNHEPRPAARLQCRIYQPRHEQNESGTLCTQPASERESERLPLFISSF